MEHHQPQNAHELFASISDQDVRWAFVILPDDRWEITRNGKRIDFGSSLRTSLDAGVARFLSLANPVAAAAGTCEPVVRQHLDRIRAGAAISQTVQTSGEPMNSTGHKVFSQHLRAL